MKKRVVILILTLVFLAGAMAAAGLPLESRAAAATPEPTATPAATQEPLPEVSPAPEALEPLAGLGGILERLAQDYDPASGAVGAYRWAESILGQYLADGRDTASVRDAGAAYAARYGENDAALKSRLETVRTAAETLTSGQELGLVRDRRLLTAGWESGEVDALFAAIAAGAGMLPPCLTVCFSLSLMEGAYHFSGGHFYSSPALALFIYRYTLAWEQPSLSTVNCTAPRSSNMPCS